MRTVSWKGSQLYTRNESSDPQQKHSESWLNPTCRICSCELMLAVLSCYSTTNLRINPLARARLCSADSGAQKVCLK